MGGWVLGGQVSVHFSMICDQNSKNDGCVKKKKRFSMKGTRKAFDVAPRGDLSPSVLWSCAGFLVCDAALSTISDKGCSGTEQELWTLSVVWTNLSQSKRNPARVETATLSMYKLSVEWSGIVNTHKATIKQYLVNAKDDEDCIYVRSIVKWFSTRTSGFLLQS